ncbi:MULTISPECIES: hypothetical protein [Bacillaceae]|uniref:hypothetical protein n=1 Tax=Bacillaceae TaxID=186817 RepID=UPI001E4C7975|nr:MULTISPECIES: hypothetical protein [Bacillaceae]MCE4051558.1 hypothetical protein [Bacillus sp. Au-Bac7]MCM3029933.1 hypothetical protein [Niallia sp. MER 6]
MTAILDSDRRLISQSVHLALVLSVLEYDRKKIEGTSFKIKNVYLNLIEHTMLKVQADLKVIKEDMKRNQLRVQRGKNDGFATEYDFYCRGYHEPHRFYNTNLKNNTQKLLIYYLMRNKE